MSAASVAVDRASAAIATAEAELEQLQKNREAADAQVTEAEANHALAREEFTRAENLVNGGISAKSAYDTARAALDATAAQREAAVARQRAAAATVQLARKRIDVARVDHTAAEADKAVRAAARDVAAATLDKTEVRAPFDGIVVLKDAEVGEVVSPNSQGGSNARGSVCTMVDLASLEVSAEVQETSLSAVAVGAPVAIYLDAWPDTAYSGRVDRIWPTANRQKASVEVRARFDAPDDRLRPEMGVRIVFLPGEAEVARVESSEPAILVPQNAVREVEGARGVFVLQRDVVEFRSIEFGDSRGGRFVVRSGLEPGQQIVLDPPLDLRSGDRVRIERS